MASKRIKQDFSLLTQRGQTHTGRVRNPKFDSVPAIVTVETKPELWSEIDEYDRQNEELEERELREDEVKLLKPKPRVVETKVSDATLLRKFKPSVELFNQETNEIYTYFNMSSGSKFSMREFMQMVRGAKELGTEGTQFRRSEFKSIKMPISGKLYYNMINTYTASSQDAAYAIKQAGLPVNAAYSFKLQPSLKPVSSIKMFQKVASLFQNAQYEGMEISSLAPAIGMLEDYKVPAYNPTYNSKGPSDHLFSALTTILSASPYLDQREGLTVLAEQMMEVSRKYMYSNGSIHLQVERLRIVMEIRKEVDIIYIKNKNNYSKMTLFEYKNVMDVYMPLHKNELSLNQSYLNMTQTIEESTYFKKQLGSKSIEVERSAVTINLHSDAGIIWGPKWKQGNTIYADNMLTDWLMKECKAKGSQVYSTYPWISMNKIKPKSDPYPVDPEKSKVRNYFSTNIFSQRPAQMVKNIAQENMGTYLTNGKTILKTSMMHGNFHEIIEKLLLTGAPFIYADNLYVLGEHVVTKKKYMLSADGVKFESCCREHYVRLENERMLSTFDKVDDMWSNYMVHFHPVSSIQGVGVLGTTQIPLNLLKSGVAGTETYNTVMTCMWHHAVTSKYGNILPITGDVDKLKFTKDVVELGEGRAGCRIIIEKSVDLDTILRGNAPQIFEFDVLGMNGVWGGFLGIDKWIPVLALDKLLISLTFNKVDTTKLSKSEIRAIEFMKLRSLYLFGGWYYDNIATLIIYRCSIILENLEEINVETFDTLVDAMEDSVIKGFGIVEGFKDYIVAGNVPDLYTTLSLLVGEPSMVKFIMEKVPREVGSLARIVPPKVMNRMEKAKLISSDDTAFFMKRTGPTMVDVKSLRVPENPAIGNSGAQNRWNSYSDIIKKERVDNAAYLLSKIPKRVNVEVKEGFDTNGALAHKMSSYFGINYYAFIEALGKSKDKFIYDQTVASIDDILTPMAKPVMKHQYVPKDYMVVGKLSLPPKEKDLKDPEITTKEEDIIVNKLKKPKEQIIAIETFEDVRPIHKVGKIRPAPKIFVEDYTPEEEETDESLKLMTENLLSKEDKPKYEIIRTTTTLNPNQIKLVKIPVGNLRSSRPLQKVSTRILPASNVVDFGES